MPPTVLTTSNASKPEWVNAPDSVVRSHSGPDSIVEIADGMLTCRVSATASRFVLFFWPPFMAFFLLVCWFGVDEPDMRAAMLILGTFCGIAFFALFFGLMRHHEARGDYLVADRNNELLSLPRHDRVFRFGDLVGFQLITGPEKNDEVINNVDFNLLVKENGTTLRYHLMGNPDRDHVQAIADFVGLPITHLRCPPGTYRSSDRDGT